MRSDKAIALVLGAHPEIGGEVLPPGVLRKQKGAAVRAEDVVVCVLPRGAVGGGRLAHLGGGEVGPAGDVD